jgi:signal peptidase
MDRQTHDVDPPRPADGETSSQSSKARHSRRSQVITGLMVVAAVAILAGGIAFRLGDFHVQTVVSGSMRPTISPGDLAITQGVPTASLQVGDVIVFTPPAESEPVIHRIASLDGDVITTKGDANRVADSWRLTLQGGTQYRLAFVVPLLGWLMELRRVALVAAGLVLALSVLLEIRKGVGARRSPVAS